MDNNCYAFVRMHYRALLAPETRQRIRQARGAALSSKQLVNSGLRAQEVVTFEKNASEGIISTPPMLA